MKWKYGMFYELNAAAEKCNKIDDSCTVELMRNVSGSQDWSGCKS